MNCPREEIASPAAATKRPAAASASAATLGSTARSARISSALLPSRIYGRRYSRRPFHCDSTTSLLLVPPRGDACAGGLHRELLGLPWRRRRHIDGVGRDDLTLQVDELEHQLVRRIRPLARIRHDPPHFPTGLRRVELADRDITDQQ